MKNHPVSRRRTSLVKALLAILPAMFVSSAFGEFVHPGIYHNADDLAFMREKIETKAEPWFGAWKALQAESSAKTGWTPHAVAVLDANKDSYMGGDPIAAYSHALQWALTGDPANAKKAIEILNAWSSTLRDIKGNTSQEKLVWGWNGCHLVNAAELLRYYVQPDGEGSGWKEKDIAEFEKMLELGYEKIKDFESGFNGNWDAAMMNTMLCTAIFMNDQAMFDKVIDHFYGKYQVSGGKTKKGDLASYILPSGQCQESGRDQGHVRMGLGHYAAICEAAWKQGVDLYGAYDNRLMAGFEYTAKYLLGYDDVPFEKIPGVQFTAISPDKREKLHGSYESIYQHYAGRKGLEMPYTRQIIYSDSETLERKNPGRYRPEATYPNSGICWGTLTMFRDSGER